MSAEDTILWRAFTDGDRSSYESIYREYFGMLYEYGMRRTMDEELVRDAIQELFVKLWANRKNLSATDKIKYYLLAAFKNTLLNMQARQGRTLDGEAFNLTFAEPVVTTREEQRQQSQQLLDALNQLSPRQKEIIYLRYFEELDYDRIAALLDISVGGVYKLHYRALDALKEILNLSHKDLLILLLLCNNWSLHA